MSQLEREPEIHTLELLGLQAIIVESGEADKAVLISIERALLVGEDGDSGGRGNPPEACRQPPRSLQPETRQQTSTTEEGEKLLKMQASTERPSGIPSLATGQEARGIRLIGSEEIKLLIVSITRSQPKAQLSGCGVRAGEVGAEVC